MPNGTVDSGYRGSVSVKLYNLSEHTYRIQKGDRIAQIVFIPCGMVQLVTADELTPSARGRSGFGSTGV